MGFMTGVEPALVTNPAVAADAKPACRVPEVRLKEG